MPVTMILISSPRSRDVAHQQIPALRHYVDIELLILLLDGKSPTPAVAGQLARPAALRVGRHDPQLHARHAAHAHRLLRRAHLEALVGRPVADAAVVRHDARARLEAQQARQQLGIEIRQQIERDHGRGGEIGLEDVAHLEAGAVAKARLLRVLRRQPHEIGIEVDAEAPRAALRRLDDDAAVARAEVDDVVVLLHLGHAQHALDDLHRRLHVRHGAVVPRPGLGLRLSRQSQRREQEEDLLQHEACHRMTTRAALLGDRGIARVRVAFG